MEKKKVLILYTMSGYGHIAAAKGIKDILDDDYEVDLEDPFASFYDRMYGAVQLKGRLLWNTLFRLTDYKQIADIIHHLNYVRFRKRLQKVLRHKQYDLIISTHGFLVNEVERALKKLELKIPFAVYITDPVTIHKLWLGAKTANYLVPISYTKELLIEDGIKEERIHKVGWILPKSFDVQREKSKEHDLLRVLVIGGGNGIGINSFIKAYAKAKQLHDQVDLTVVCGRNKKLIEELKTNYTHLPHLHVMGYIDNMAEVMAQYDLIAGKAGTAVMFEAFASGKPVMFTSKVLQQEIGNTDLVKKKQLGWILEDSDEMVEILSSILKDRNILQEKEKGIINFWEDQKETRKRFKETVHSII